MAVAGWRAFLDGLNQFLPNLPAAHLMGLPSGTRGVRLALAGSAREVEWAPGEKSAWKPTESADVRREQNLKNAMSEALKISVTAIATAKDYIYAGDSEGRCGCRRMRADLGRAFSLASRAG